MKSKKHNKITKDFNNQKSKHLGKLATKMLKDDERKEKLRTKEINPKFLNLF